MCREQVLKTSYARASENQINFIEVNIPILDYLKSGIDKVLVSFLSTIIKAASGRSLHYSGANNDGWKIYQLHVLVVLFALLAVI